jgi:hypothetical protein
LPTAAHFRKIKKLTYILLLLSYSRFRSELLQQGALLALGGRESSLQETQNLLQEKLLAILLLVVFYFGLQSRILLNFQVKHHRNLIQLSKGSNIRGLSYLSFELVVLIVHAGEFLGHVGDFGLLLQAALFG